METLDCGRFRPSFAFELSSAIDFRIGMTFGASVAINRASA